MKTFKLTNNQFIHASARLVTSATLAMALAFAPGITFAVTATYKDVHEDRTEVRIKNMHTKLKITQAQEEQWAKVTQTMLDDAKIMDALTQARADHADDMNAIDDLKSYGEIVEAHADGIKKLTPVFASLYASMSEAQKTEADTFFRKGEQKNSDKKSVGK